MPTDLTVAALVARLDAHLKEAFEERAAIREFDAGIARDHAECLGLLDVINSYPDEFCRCLLGCG